MEPEFSYLAPSQAFLDPDRVDAKNPSNARAVIIPYGLEASVSYGGGTAFGPEAILAASHQLELFDDEFWCQPCDSFGIATLDLPPVDMSRGLASALEKLEKIVEQVLLQERFPFVIGGEHSLTAGAIRPFAKRFDDLVVLQIDAHADLRDGYLGEHYSHASAMRRVLDFENVSLVSFGVRALSQEEATFYETNRDRISMNLAKDMERWDIDAIVSELKGRPVYISFDIDGLDGAVMPATGTPTPGGLSYAKALSILRAVRQNCSIVGADLVELAPVPNLHACDFLAAQLAYKMISYALCDRDLV